MAILRRAIADGYRDADLMRTEAGLEPIRDRPDFQILMMDLAFPEDPLARDR